MNLTYRRTIISAGQRPFGTYGIRSRAAGRDFYYRFYRPVLYPLFRPYSIAFRAAFAAWEKILTLLFIPLPLLAIPIFIHLTRIMYPGVQVTPKVFREVIFLRPPNERSFWQEMLTLIIALLIVASLQVVLGLILRKKGPWGEALGVSALMALPAYGVLRGFQASPSDAFFYPLPSLWIALIMSIGLSTTILFRHLRQAFSL